jgi:hypothetical protein
MVKSELFVSGANTTYHVLVLPVMKLLDVSIIFIHEVS